MPNEPQCCVCDQPILMASGQHVERDGEPWCLMCASRYANATKDTARDLASIALVENYIQRAIRSQYSTLSANEQTLIAGNLRSFWGYLRDAGLAKTSPPHQNPGAALGPEATAELVGPLQRLRSVAAQQAALITKECATLVVAPDASSETLRQVNEWVERMKFLVLTAEAADMMVDKIVGRGA